MTLTLGTGSYICEPKHIHGGINDIIIGNWCSIAAQCTFDAGFGHDYKNVTTFPMHTLRPDVPSNVYSRGNITIESDVWIGMNVTIMSGVTIHSGAVIGTNTTVRRNIEPYEIYIGGDYTAPFLENSTIYHGRKKFRFNQSIINQLLEIAWWDWHEEKILANAHLLAQPNIERFINERI